MSARQRVEQALETVLARAEQGPPGLASTMRHVVMPGGARVRPILCLSVAMANGDGAPALADAAAAAVELLHCASLAHDDLPCFDDATLRRGKPAAHVAFSEPLALLAGDALIIAAFETLARAGAAQPDRLAPLITLLGRAAGAPFGLCAGQAWESEIDVPLEAYHRSKTGALFVAATMAGATAAGVDPAPWRALGERLGEAYQVADDLMDALSSEAESGKTAGRDASLGRPSAVRALGVAGAAQKLDGLVRAALDSIPDCDRAGELRDLVRAQALRLAPRQLAMSVA